MELLIMICAAGAALLGSAAAAGGVGQLRWTPPHLVIVV